MKLILSRKGFDSTAGGVPSPIFPDGRMVSFPIPDKDSVISYSEITYDGDSLGPLVEHLTGGQIPQHYRAHLDPVLVRGSLPRQSGWRPIFGQGGQAQGHLRNNRIGVGDLFLFYGLFRHVEHRNSVYSWATKTKPCHVIWGWLQVAEVLPLGSSIPSGYQWAKYHPHFHGSNDKNNVVYLARRHLNIGVEANDTLPGAGVFPRFSYGLQLTAREGHMTITWDLPSWFNPVGGRTPLSYHSDPKRWQKDGSRTLLKAVARGQEFVIDCDEYPEAPGWVHGLLQNQEIKW